MQLRLEDALTSATRKENRNGMKTVVAATENDGTVTVAIASATVKVVRLLVSDVVRDNDAYGSNDM